MRVRLAVLAAVALALLSGASGVPAPLAFPATVHAQSASPETDAAVDAVTGAFERLALDAEGGDWQAADAAYNAALDAMDAHRTELETAFGDPAIQAFADIDSLLPDLGAGLDAEDATGVRATVAVIVAELVPLHSSGTQSGNAELAMAVLDWRARVEAIVALGDSGAWRDMRNAALELTDDVGRRGPLLVAKAPDEAARQVDVLRVFAMRLRLAAQLQSAADAKVAASFANDALDALSQVLNTTGPATQTPPLSGVVARAYDVQGAVGEVVVVPVVLDGVPQIGLGAASLDVGWSPTAMRLLDVGWDVGTGEGTVVRDDAAGRVSISLPPAPVGPSGNVVLARLRFQVASDVVDARDYLPRSDVDALESASRQAREWVRQGDTPRASDALAGGYAVLLGGRTRPGSLYQLLDRHGLADPLWASLLTALDLVTQPAETDRIVVSLDDLDDRMSATWAANLAALGGAEGIPVTVEVTAATDTSGDALPIDDDLPGLVVLPTGGPQVGTTSAGAAVTSTLTATVTSAVKASAPSAGTASIGTRPTAAVTGTVPAAPSPAAVAQGAGSLPPAGPALPLPLVGALLVAAVVGLLAVAVSDRGPASGPGGQAGGF